MCFMSCFFFPPPPGLDEYEKQTVQHKLAELKTEICVSRAFIDSCLQLHAEGRLDSATASMAKYWWEQFLFNVHQPLINFSSAFVVCSCLSFFFCFVIPPGHLTSRTRSRTTACSSTEAGATCGSIPLPSECTVVCQS